MVRRSAWAVVAVLSLSFVIGAHAVSSTNKASDARLTTDSSWSIQLSFVANTTGGPDGFTSNEVYQVTGTTGSPSGADVLAAINNLNNRNGPNDTGIPQGTDGSYWSFSLYSGTPPSPILVYTQKSGVLPGGTLSALVQVSVELYLSGVLQTAPGAPSFPGPGGDCSSLLIVSSGSYVACFLPA